MLGIAFLLEKRFVASKTFMFDVFDFLDGQPYGKESEPPFYFLTNPFFVSFLEKILIHPFLVPITRGLLRLLGVKTS